MVTSCTFKRSVTKYQEYPFLAMASMLTSEDMLDRLTELFVSRGIPANIRSNNKLEFTARKVSRLDVPARSEDLTHQAGKFAGE